MKKITKGTFILGLLLIISGYMVIGLDRVNRFIKDKMSEDKVSFYLSSKEITGEPVRVEEETEEVQKAPHPDVIGVLEIPSIGFRREFYKINSPHNNVEENIQVMASSTMPNIIGGNLIFAAHSGTGWKAFFNGLINLRNNDKIYVYYDGYKYTYKVTKIYNEEKTGSIHVSKESGKTMITLTTCNRITKGQQLIVMGEQVDIEAY